MRRNALVYRSQIKKKDGRRLLDFRVVYKELLHVFAPRAQVPTGLRNIVDEISSQFFGDLNKREGERASVST